MPLVTIDAPNCRNPDWRVKFKRLAFDHVLVLNGTWDKRGKGEDADVAIWLSMSP